MALPSEVDSSHVALKVFLSHVALKVFLSHVALKVFLSHVALSNSTLQLSLNGSVFKGGQLSCSSEGISLSCSSVQLYATIKSEWLCLQRWKNLWHVALKLFLSQVALSNSTLQLSLSGSVSRGGTTCGM